MRIGIVGNGEDKFTELGEQRAKELIEELLQDASVLVSGHSPVGGIDIWSEEAAVARGIPTDIKTPKQHKWDAPYGYKARNLDIAASDVVYVIVADVYPDEYEGRRFKACYHCVRQLEYPPEHVKSGGCWTGYKALEAGNRAEWHIVRNYE